MNQEELEAYIRIYGKDIYSFCCSITRNRQEADDLYQDTFLKAYELGDRVVIERNPKSFLMSVAVNLYRNYKRKLSVRQKIVGIGLSLEENAVEIPDNGLIPEESIVKREENEVVRHAVSKLSDKYRLPILLFYMEELSISEMAVILQLSEGTVKSRIHRAKKILKQRLEAFYYEK